MRKVKPYYFEYKSFAKGRWLGRSLLEVFSSEFRDRSEDYYVSTCLCNEISDSSGEHCEISTCSNGYTHNYYFYSIALCH
jgi:hypothetical protein